MKQISLYCETLRLAAGLRPSHINRYLVELAGCFHRSTPPAVSGRGTGSPLRPPEAGGPDPQCAEKTACSCWRRRAGEDVSAGFALDFLSVFFDPSLARRRDSFFAFLRGCLICYRAVCLGTCRESFGGLIDSRFLPAAEDSQLNCNFFVNTLPIGYHRANPC